MKPREPRIRSGGKYMKPGPRALGMLLVLMASSVLVVVGALIAYTERSLWIGIVVLVIAFVLLSSAKYFVEGAKA